MNTPKLCYVNDCWAFFTTQELSKQWGDDWNDAPYDCNAGDPYEFSDHDKKQGKEPWEIIRVAFYADLEGPGASYGKSRLAVEDINAGKSPWLTRNYCKGEVPKIMAGTTLEDFISIVQADGGQIYTRHES